MNGRSRRERPALCPCCRARSGSTFYTWFYLEGFARAALVAVEDEQGRRRFEIERLLSASEGKANPVIERLAASQQVDADQRTSLAPPTRRFTSLMKSWSSFEPRPTEPS